METGKDQHHQHTSEAASSHKMASPEKLKVALITVSTSRFKYRSMKDESGEIARELVQKARHEVLYSVIDDDRRMIRYSLYKSLVIDNCDAVIFVGGTGLSPRDVTVEAISPLIDKNLDGFGEIFRRLSFDSIGSPAIMTRALGGVVDSRVVFCLPGSPDASKLGIELILKELPHAVFIARGT